MDIDEELDNLMTNAEERCCQVAFRSQDVGDSDPEPLAFMGGPDALFSPRFVRLVRGGPFIVLQVFDPETGKQEGSLAVPDFCWQPLIDGMEDEGDEAFTGS